MVELPLQMVTELLASTIGLGLTATVAVAVSRHPFVSVPITVNVSVVNMENGAPSVMLSDQVYETAPLPDNVTTPLSQNCAEGLAVTVICDGLKTVTVMMEESAEQPLALVTIAR